jgi:plastocyanin
MTLPVPSARAARSPGLEGRLGGGAEGVVEGTVWVGGQRAKDVVVWLVDVQAPAPAQGRVVLDQRKLTFTPHILAVRVGTSVEMPNNDRVFHNVFSFKDGKKFDLGLYPVGQSKLVTFDRPGVSRIFCNIHPSMAAYVIAVDSAFFGVSDNAGRFTLAPVPPGAYTFRAWRPGQDVTTGQVVVVADRPLEVLLP